MHSNGAPKMGAARNLAHAGALLRITPRCGTCWGVLQALAEGREGGLGRDVGVNGTRAGARVLEELEVAGGTVDDYLPGYIKEGDM